MLQKYRNRIESVLKSKLFYLFNQTHLLHENIFQFPSNTVRSKCIIQKIKREKREQ